MMSAQQKFDEAFAKHQAGDIAAALPLYRSILDIEPQHPNALHMLGIIAQQMKNPALALQLMDAALATNPSMAMAWFNRSLVLRVLDRSGEALQSAERALESDAHLAAAWDMAGTLLRETGRYEESAKHHARAVELEPQNVRFNSNHTSLLLALGKVQEAYQSALTTQKLDHAFVPLPLGNVLQAAGYPEKAIPYFQKSYEVLPDFKDARINEAMARLQIGDFEQGWALWETRPDNKECFQSIPRWQGQKVSHLLLHEDQGMGDALQCIRYIPMIRDRAEKITLQLTGHLKTLLTLNLPDIDIITLDDPVPTADARLQLMSLPHLFQTRIDTIPSTVPYLRAAEEWRMPWHQALAALPNPRIGLVWGGNPDNRNDRNRSIPFPVIQGILRDFAPHLVSLQKGRQKDQSGLAATGVFDADPQLNDFSSTAGLLAELDLLISVDTAAVHLAGAMGRPAWLLLPFEPEWRWMHGREDSPWYPSLRLFRQTTPHDWASVLTRVAVELQKFIGGDSDVLKPAHWSGSPLRQNPHAIVLRAGEDE